MRKLFDLFQLTFREWVNDNTFRMAASLAFYTVFSLAPILLIVVAVAGLLFSRESVTHQVVEQVEQLIGPQGAHLITLMLESSGKGQGGIIATIIGLITLMVGSTAVFMELQSALNEIWDVKADPQEGAVEGYILRRLRSFSIVIGLGFLLLVSLLITAALAGAQSFISEKLGGIPVVWQVTNLISSFLTISLLFGITFKYLPDVRLTWRDVGIGAIMTAALFTIGKYAIGLYLGHMSLASTFGGAGSFAVLLLWIYYSALIIFFGAEFTQVYTRRYGSKIQPEKPHAVRMGRKGDSL